jgi:hypothetical protein
MGVFRATVQDRLILPAQARLTLGDEQAFRMLGRPIPAALAVRLLIDTGSKRSSMVPWILNRLRPTTTHRVTVETSLATTETELFWVRLEFPGTALAAVPELAVARLPMPRSLQDYHGVAGRDILSRWESLLYEGRRSRFTIRDSLGGLFGWLRR